MSLAALPLLAHSAVVTGAGYTVPLGISAAPGQIITFFVQGIGATLSGPLTASSLPLPNSLGGISATFVQGDFLAPVPMLAVQPQNPCGYPTDPGCAASYAAVTVQIPYGFEPNGGPMGPGSVPPAQIRFSEDGSVAASADLVPVADQVHILQLCSYPPLPTCSASGVTHADGSPVSVASPATTGEEISIWALGLGPVQSPIAAGQAPSSPLPSFPSYISVAFDAHPNALAARPPASDVNALLTPVFVGLAPNYVGLYQINVIVPALPAGTPPCDNYFHGVESNLTISVIGSSSFDGIGICVQPSPVPVRR